MAPSPYAPPRAESPAVGVVSVAIKDPIPLVCLKCGATKDIAPRPETMTIVTRRTRLVALGLALVGGVVVATVQSLEVRIGVLVGVVVAARVMRMGVRPTLPKVDLGLPLCPSCNERWTIGMRRRRIFRALTFVCLVLMLACMALAAPLVGLLFISSSMAFAIANLLVRIRSRVVVATALKDDVVTLSLVHPDAVAAINSARA